MTANIVIKEMQNEREQMDKLCDYDEAFTRKEIYEETNFCIKCKYNSCPYHIKAIKEDPK